MWKKKKPEQNKVESWSVLLSSPFEDHLLLKKALQSEMRTEIPDVAADIKNLNLRVSNKFIKFGALVRKSMHEKQK